MRLIDADALLEEVRNNYEGVEYWRIIERINNAPTVQREGWVSVPIEPTKEMIQDGYTALMEWDARTGEDIGIGDVYKAMIQAAPTDTE